MTLKYNNKSIVFIAFFSLFLTFFQTANASEKSPQYGLILFYRHDCPHCQRFEPIVKNVVLKHRLPILAYTLDHQPLASFPNSVTPTQEEVSKFFPMHDVVVPALFLLDTRTHRLYPVLRGEASDVVLEQAIFKAISMTRTFNQEKEISSDEQDFRYEKDEIN